MHPHLQQFARSQYGTFTTAQALGAGYSPDEIRQRASTGSWIRLRRGAFTDAATWENASDDDRHLLTIAAIQSLGSSPIAASHWSAALAHGLPMIRARPDLPQLAANREHFRTLPGARLFNGALHPGHTIDHRGLLVTTVARTISDIARTHALDDAVVMYEHALRSGDVAESDLRRVIADCPTWRGIAWSKRTLQLAQPLNESPGESLSYLRMRAHKIVLPACQVSVRVRDRTYRLDFLWLEEGVAGEFDGRGKYAEKADLYAEKQREDDLRSMGLIVARWGWADVRGTGDPMARILRRAFAAAVHTPRIHWDRLLVA